jgi:hypothetical protein
MKKKVFPLFLILLLCLPTCAQIQIPASQTYNFILFDINADGKKEIVAEQNKCITVYQVKSEQFTELSKTNSLGTVEDFLATDKELYILMNKNLYQCNYANNKLSFIKIRDLSSEIDYMFYIFRDSNNILNVIGKKTLKPSKVVINLVKLTDNKTLTYPLQTFNDIYAMHVLNENHQLNILVINGVEERSRE